MIVEQIPHFSSIPGKAGVDRVKQHILGILMLGNRENAKKLRYELIECLAIVENTLQRDKLRPKI